ncbi:MAG: DUF6340 family protein [Bacteroidales bacterium]
MNKRRPYGVLTAWWMILPVVFTSCGVHKMAVDVYRPPEVSLPEDLQRIAVISRLGEIESQDIDNLVEGIFTGQGGFVQQLGAHQATLGAMDYLEYSREFEDVFRVKLNNTDTGYCEMPLPLDQQILDQVKEEHHADAAVVVEYLVTSNQSFAESRKVYEQQKKNEVWENTVIYNVGTVERFVAVLKVELSTGWRLYDLRRNRIVDEYESSDSIFWEVDGSSRRAALSRLPNKNRAVEEVGFMAGEKYALRITPGWRTVRRTFLTGKRSYYKNIRQKLKRRMYGDLKEIWQQGLRSDKTDIRITALYNLAILYEMEGDLEKARQLLEEALELKDFSRAGNYLKMIIDKQNTRSINETDPE